MTKALDNLTKIYVNEYPRRIIELLCNAKDKQLRQLDHLITTDNLIEYLQLCNVNQATNIFSRVKKKTKIKILNKVPVSTLFYLLSLVSNKEKAQLTKALDDKTKNLVLQYSKSKTLALLQKIHYPFVVQQHMSVNEALKALAQTTDSIYKYIFVLDHEGFLAGVLSIKQLYRAERQKKIHEIMRKKTTYLSINQLEVTRLKSFFRSYAICPVVDGGNRFLGIIKSENVNIEDEKESDTFIVEGMELIVDMSTDVLFKFTEIFADVCRKRS